MDGTVTKASAQGAGIAARQPVAYGKDADGFAKVYGLHHFAYLCKDAEETRHFYEDVLGLPLACVLVADELPSTGDKYPYTHLFFELRDGSYVAFFDIGDELPQKVRARAETLFNHLALEVADEAALLDSKRRLEAAGVEVVGPTDHGFLHSIYFFDPNGLRLELTTRTVDASVMKQKRDEARQLLDRWTRDKHNRKKK
jgi:catechol 2,3-dioxygenase-like lactoylglutathione lyase family enzyme